MALNLQNFFALKPNVNNISQPQNLRDFINKYPNEELRPSMRKLLVDYHNFRPIKGDGNCFYRACAYLYFCNSDLNNFATLFPEAPIFNCQCLPFIREDNINAQEVLQYIWRVYFKPIANQPNNVRYEKIEDIFNCSFPLDAVIVAYFRSLNHKYLKSQQTKFKAYTENIDKQMKKILTLYEESEGVEIYSLAQRLNAKITIMMTHEKTLKEVKYNQGGKHHFILFYRPGHYDILMPVTYKVGFLSTPVEQISEMYPRLPYQAPPPRIKKQEKANESKQFVREEDRFILAPFVVTSNNYQERPINSIEKFNDFQKSKQKEMESNRQFKFDTSKDTPKKILEQSRRDTPLSRSSRFTDRSTTKKQQQPEEELEEVYVRAPRNPAKRIRLPSINQIAVYKDAILFFTVFLLVFIIAIQRLFF